MRNHSAEHHPGKQSGTEATESWSEQRNGTDNLKRCGDITEPLSNTNQVEDIHHLLDAHKFGNACGQKDNRRKCLQPPQNFIFHNPDSNHFGYVSAWTSRSI